VSEYSVIMGGKRPDPIFALYADCKSTCPFFSPSPDPLVPPPFPIDAYKILEIQPESSPLEIKKAYRKMVKKFHPDKVQHLGKEHQNGAEEKFRKVQEAYEQLQKEIGF